MPFNIKKASEKINRVEVRFNNQTLVCKYQAGAKYKDFQKNAQRRQIEYTRLDAQMQRAMRDDAPRSEGAREDEQLLDELLANLRRSRRNLADAVCSIVTEWDLTGDCAEIREEHYESLTEDEREALPDEDKQALENPSRDDGKIPIEGAWLDALPLPDDFISRVLDEINADYASGGKGSKKH